jgi:hypothetical protein
VNTESAITTSNAASDNHVVVKVDPRSIDIESAMCYVLYNEQSVSFFIAGRTTRI